MFSREISHASLPGSSRPAALFMTQAALAVAAALALGACGGGGDSASTPQPVSLTQGTANTGGGTATPDTGTGTGTGSSGGTSPPPIHDAPAPSIPTPEGYQRVTAQSLQAQVNMAYAIDASAASPTTITLPVDARAGDTLKLQGIGAGSWRVAQGTGQEVITSALPSLTWQEIGPSPKSQPWWAVASSWDGSILMAASNPGNLYLSSDGGTTWTQRLHTTHWSALAITPDGQHMVATAFGEHAWVSHDHGQTWTETAEVRDWVSAAISNDGQRIAIDGKADRVHVSSDGGRTWSAHTGVADWQSVASSSDGLRLFAGVGPGVPPVGSGSLWLSDDAGITWRTTAAGLRAWYRVASSQDGQFLSASDAGGYLYISQDRGVNWAPRFREGPINFISMSGDTHQMVVDVPKVQAILPDGKIHLSTDRGLTWIALEQDRIWRGLTLSGDGRVLLAADHEGTLHLSRGHRTRQGSDGFIGAGPSDSLELECLGNGVWRVRAASGTGFSVH